MRIRCLKEDLRNACLIAERVSGKNTTLPILSTVLLTGEKGKFKITSTNLEIGFEATIPAQVEEEGRVAIPAHTISGFLGSLPSEMVTLEAEKENLRVRGERISTLMKGHASDDFPIFPSVKKKSGITAPAKVFYEGLRSVCFAAALSDIKPEIASIFIFSNQHVPLTFVATDSFRLSSRTFSDYSGQHCALLLPYRSAAEFLRILEQRDGDVELAIDASHALFTHKNFRFISRLTEGSFPDYQQIIPKSFKTEALLSTAVLTGALRTASVFSGRLHMLSLRLHPEDNLVEVETSADEVGEHNETVPATISGEGANLSFNCRYLLDGLSHVSDEETYIGCNGEGKPLVMRGKQDNAFLYLVMPMKNT